MLVWSFCAHSRAFTRTADAYRVSSSLHSFSWHHDERSGGLCRPGNGGGVYAIAIDGSLQTMLVPSGGNIISALVVPIEDVAHSGTMVVWKASDSSPCAAPPHHCSYMRVGSCHESCRWPVYNHLALRAVSNACVVHPNSILHAA